MNSAKAAKELGISKVTLVRWINQNKVPDVAKDRNGHRVFTDKDLERIKAYRDMLIPAK